MAALFLWGGHRLGEYNRSTLKPETIPEQNVRPVGRDQARGFSGSWVVVPVAFFAAFVLPFFFPNDQLVYSSTYVAGSNNKVATITLALLSFGVAAWAARLWQGRKARVEPTGEDFAEKSERIPGLYLLVGAGLIAVWTIVFGWVIARSGIRFGESSYFLERSRDVVEFGARIYRDIEFPYGPLLLEPPVWMAKIVGPAHLTGCFFAWLTVLNVAGILMVAYCLNKLPLSRSSRKVLFVVFCFEQLHPLVGPNYSLGKFLLPFAVLLWGTSRGNAVKRALGLAAGYLLVVMVSPELGVGLAAAIVGWAVVTAFWTRNEKGEQAYGDLLSVLAPVVGYGVFLAMYGRGFLDRLSHASGGALNLVIEPLPDMLIFLVAVVWLAPVAVGSSFRKRGNLREAAVLTGVFLLSLGLLPGAMGRADPLHVFFNGFGFLVLSLVGIERLGRGRRLLWVGLVVVLAVQVQATNFIVYNKMLPVLASAGLHPERAQPGFDANALKQATHGEHIETPALLQMPLADEMALRRANLFEPDWLAGLAEIWDRDGEEAKIARMREHQWALAPASDYSGGEGSPNNNRIKRIFRFGYRYPVRHQPYVVGLLMEQELSTRWTVVGRFGDMILYRRND